jgi:5'-nucleotidase
MQTPFRPSILISNDDGILATGIAALAEVAREFGEVTVVAPDSPQSGMGHAISLGVPLRLYKAKLTDGTEGYACSGTPADCVKLATGVLMRNHLPDIILSGVNHGSNASISTIYSGTLAAAREGAIQGFPAIGFSVLNHGHEIDLEASKHVIRLVLKKIMKNPLASGELLSVNIPYIPLENIKGIKTTRQAIGRWVEEFEERKDPYGQPYYWLTGSFDLQDDRKDTDILALTEGYVSITPLAHDLTHSQHFDRIKDRKWEIDEAY